MGFGTKTLKIGQEMSISEYRSKPKEGVHCPILNIYDSASSTEIY